jgi:putative transposase
LKPRAKDFPTIDSEQFNPELVRRTIFQSRIEAASAIGRYIDGFYNPVRRHSALDFISPLQFEGRAA